MLHAGGIFGIFKPGHLGRTHQRAAVVARKLHPAERLLQVVHHQRFYLRVNHDLKQILDIDCRPVVCADKLAYVRAVRLAFARPVHRALQRRIAARARRHHVKPGVLRLAFRQAAGGQGVHEVFVGDARGTRATAAPVLNLAHLKPDAFGHVRGRLGVRDARGLGRAAGEVRIL